MFFDEMTLFALCLLRGRGLYSIDECLLPCMLIQLQPFSLLFLPVGDDFALPPVFVIGF
jgi:hypothetical protein